MSEINIDIGKPLGSAREAGIPEPKSGPLDSNPGFRKKKWLSWVRGSGGGENSNKDPHQPLTVEDQYNQIWNKGEDAFQQNSSKAASQIIKRKPTQRGELPKEQ